MINKKAENVKKDLYDVNIPYFKFPPQGERFNNDDILKSWFGEVLGGRYNEYLDGLLSCFFHDFRGVHDSHPEKGSVFWNISSRIIPFFYSEALDSILLHKNQHIKLFSYWNGIKLKFKEALGLSKYENDLTLIIETVDEKSIKDLILQSEALYNDSNVFYRNIINLPRFRKLCRLRNFNDFIIKTCLSMLHLFYWIDFKNNVTNKKNINEYIEKVINITLQLSNMLYEELNEEFPDDVIAKEINRIKLKK